MNGLHIANTSSQVYNIGIILSNFNFENDDQKKIQQNLYLCENNHNQYTVVYTTVKTHMLILKFCFLLQFIRWPRKCIVTLNRIFLCVYHIKGFTVKRLINQTNIVCNSYYHRSRSHRNHLTEITKCIL